MFLVFLIFLREFFFNLPANNRFENLGYQYPALDNGPHLEENQQCGTCKSNTNEQSRTAILSEVQQFEASSHNHTKSAAESLKDQQSSLLHSVPSDYQFGVALINANNPLDQKPLENDVQPNQIQETLLHSEVQSVKSLQCCSPKDHQYGTVFFTGAPHSEVQQVGVPSHSDAENLDTTIQNGVMPTVKGHYGPYLHSETQSEEAQQQGAGLQNSDELRENQHWKLLMRKIVNIGMCLAVITSIVLAVVYAVQVYSRGII